MLDEALMASVLARLRACPEVFAVALLDSSGTRLAQDIADTSRGVVEHVVASLIPVLEEMRRTEPAWSSVFLDVGTDYVVGRRVAEYVVLVLAHPPLAISKLNQVLDSSMDEIWNALGRPGSGTHRRSGTVQLSDEDVVWLLDEEDELFDSILDDELFEAELSAASLASLPQLIPPETDITDRMNTQEMERLPDELAAVTNIIERHGALERQMKLARRVQASLLPAPGSHTLPFADIAVQFYPADLCSGDWWTVDVLPDGRVLFVIGDVTGHGVGPAMITAMAQGACDATRAQLGAGVTCEALLRSMNTSIYRSARSSLLMTCVVCILDPRNGTMSVSNAGHTFPLLTRQWENKIHIRELVIRGSPLGSSQDLDLSTMVVSLQPDDVLFWYTDGVIDCENEQGKQFGRKRLLQSLRRQSSREPAVICDAFRHLLAGFRGSQKQSDDVAFAVARIKG